MVVINPKNIPKTPFFQYFLMFEIIFGLDNIYNTIRGIANPAVYFAKKIPIQLRKMPNINIFDSFQFLKQKKYIDNIVIEILGISIVPLAAHNILIERPA
ncbi:hypothetical protein [Methanobrevibacter arboriphilus]|uniref:hypothetical protein n=1 Tax=Methanobrevibacter arboriphilus TaxID=39441 RepID=UPI000B24D9F4|nr:hypothetical protein [Methanobrevibacter arboriphilus]